jgi:hypothetical protein
VIPRFLHRQWAFWFGFSWSECPRCGEWFGGHERGTGVLWHSPARLWGVLTCPNCPGDYYRGPTSIREMVFRPKPDHDMRLDRPQGPSL